MVGKGNALARRSAAPAKKAGKESLAKSNNARTSAPETVTVRQELLASATVSPDGMEKTVLAAMLA